MPKVIKVLLILLAVVVIGFGAYVFRLKFNLNLTSSDKEVPSWKTYTNENLKYSFQYPASSAVDENSINTTGTLNQTTSPVYVSNPKNTRTALFNIEPDPPALMHGSPTYPIFLNVKLQELAQMIWGANKTLSQNFPSKKISELTQTTLAGSLAYEFSLDSVFSIGSSGYMLDTEHKYILVEGNGHKFMISLPTNEPDAQKILSTFKFTK